MPEAPNVNITGGSVCVEHAQSCKTRRGHAYPNVLLEVVYCTADWCTLELGAVCLQQSASNLHRETA